MKDIRAIIFFSILLLLAGCVTEFIPETNEEKELLVVEGLITDQPEAYTVKLSKSLPLGKREAAKPLSKCIVTITDNEGNTFRTKETLPGTYITDPAYFRGIIGKKYVLHIVTNLSADITTYESYPVEMKPVPPIDSLYYQRKVIKEGNETFADIEGAQVYLDTHSPDNSCKYYRWEFVETWEFHLPYQVPNYKCWISNNSDIINVKSTTALSESKIKEYPLNFISNGSDRLSVKYSLLAKQYSLSEDEFTYWDKLKYITEQVGGLYDIIPNAIPSNIICIDNPEEKVLGFFSVSASTSKRMFIKSNFYGLVDLYRDCVADTLFDNKPIQGLGTYVWVIVDHTLPPPSYKVITYNEGCYDCSVRGTTKEPDFWRDYK